MKRLFSISLLLWLWTLALMAADPTPKSPGSSPVAATERMPRGIEWEVMFDDGIEIKQYAKELDYFKIEVGAEDSNGEIQYASGLSHRRPERHSGNHKDDGRFTTAWKKGTLLAIDTKLLTKAGVKTIGKKILHFYPRELESQLEKLEREHAGPNARIGRTRFKIRPDDSGQGYEFYVAEQDLLAETPGTPPKSSAAGRQAGR